MPTFTTIIPKLVTTTSADFTLTNSNPVLTNEGSTQVVTYTKTVPVDLAVFTFTGTYGTTTTIVTVSSLEVLKKIEIGDTITIAGGDTSGSTLPGATTVADIDEVSLTFTLSAAPTSTGTGTVTFSCNPAAKTTTLFQLKEKQTVVNNKFKVEIYYIANDKSSPTETKLGEFSLNMEQFFALEGISKTNDNTLTI